MLHDWDIKDLLVQKYWQLISTKQLWSVPNIVSSKSRTVQYRVPRCPGQYRVPRCPSQYRNVQVPSCPGTEMSRIQKDARPCLCMCMDELYWKKKKKWKKALLSHIALHIFIHQSSEKSAYFTTRCLLTYTLSFLFLFFRK